MLIRSSALVLLCVLCATIAGAQLELVHLVFRHGQRTPDATYPTDPYANHTFFPYGLGQLTNQGKKDQFDQGTFLRKRYNIFLGKIYSPRMITVQSSDLDRTHMSAQLEMAGLWAPEPPQKWNAGLNWQPIAVHSKSIEEDSMILAFAPCPYYTEEMNRVLKSPELQAILKKNHAKELYEELTALTGMEISTPRDILFLYSTLKAEEELSLRLPAWTRRFYPNKLIPMAKLSFQIFAYNKEMQKLKGGPLLKKILDDTRKKAAGFPNLKEKKMFVYSGHDITVSTLLQTLQVWDRQLPPYGSMVIIELHRQPKSNTHAIKIFLRNDTSHQPYALTLPGCEHLCPLDKFVELTQDVIPENWSESCKGVDGEDESIAYRLGSYSKYSNIVKF